MARAMAKLVRTTALIAVAVVFSFVLAWHTGSQAQTKAAAKTQVVFLGTGAPRPSTDRFGPATAIVAGDRAFLVDFGPGVVRRAAAAAERNPALQPTTITTAFITHLHSDHTVGYPELIFTPWTMGRKELSVYGPEGTEEMTKHVLEAWRRDIEIRTQGLEHSDALVVHAHDVGPGVAY